MCYTRKRIEYTSYIVTERKISMGLLKSPHRMGVICLILGIVIPPLFPILEPIAGICFLIAFVMKE